MRDEKVVRALHEPYDASLVNEQVTYPRFMASTHVKILEVFPFHEPTKGPPGFGLRQSSGAFARPNQIEKRQRTGAVQDAIATDAPASAVHGPNACAKTKGGSMNQRSLPKRNSVHHCRRIHPQSRPFTATIAPDKNVGPGRLHWCPWTVRLRPCPGRLVTTC